MYRERVKGRKGVMNMGARERVMETRGGDRSERGRKREMERHISSLGMLLEYSCTT